VHDLESVNFFVWWGGNKETNGHKADYFDYHVLYRLPYDLAYEGDGRPYPFNLNILFCDGHAIEINNIDPNFVESYKKGLDWMLKQKPIGKNYNSFTLLSDIINNAEELYYYYEKVPEFKSQILEMMKNQGIQHDPNIDIVTLMEQLKQDFANKGQLCDLFELLESFDPIYIGKFAEQNFPGLKHFSREKEDSKINADVLWWLPEVRKIFEGQAAKYANYESPAQLKASGRKYISARSLDSKILTATFPNSIFISFGSPTKEYTFQTYQHFTFIALRAKLQIKNWGKGHGAWTRKRLIGIF
jgi:prepilin-type processing-associated H-X9-DG protein